MHEMEVLQTDEVRPENEGRRIRGSAAGGNVNVIHRVVPSCLAV